MAYMGSRSLQLEGRLIEKGTLKCKLRGRMIMPVTASNYDLWQSSMLMTLSLMS